MAHYSVVLTVVRFVAIAIGVFYLYVMISVLISIGIGIPAGMANMESMIRHGQNQTIVECFKAIVASVVLYFMAPFFSHLIAAGPQSRR